MKKFSFVAIMEVWKYFVGQLKKPFVFFLIPLSFAYCVVISVLIFVRTIIAVLFGNVLAASDDAANFRAAVALAQAPLLIARNMIFGALDVACFLFGLFFDLNGKIMSLGQGESYYIQFK